MTIDMQGPLSLLVPKAKAAAGSTAEGGAMSADEAAAPRSFADILAAAQPVGDAQDAITGPAREDDAQGDAPPVDAAVATTLPPWLVPTLPIVLPPPRQDSAAGDAAKVKVVDVSDIIGGAGAKSSRIAPPAELAPASVDPNPRPDAAGDDGGLPALMRAADAGDGRPAAAAQPMTTRAGAGTPAPAADASLAAIARALAPAPGNEPRPAPTTAQATPAAVPGKVRRTADADPGRGDVTAANSPLADGRHAASVATVIPSTPVVATAPAAAVAPMHGGRDESTRDAASPAVPGAVPAPAAVVPPVEESRPPPHEAAAAPVAGPAASTDAAPLAATPHPVRTFEPAADPVQVEIARPVGTSAWTQDVTGALAHAISVRHTSAQLHLHPESMGPVDVRISVTGNEANVQLVAAHAATREALENALPALRDLLGSQGLALGQAAVESRAQQDSPPPSGQPQHAAGGDAPRTAAVEDAPATVARVLRLLDVFA